MLYFVGVNVYLVYFVLCFLCCFGFLDWLWYLEGGLFWVYRFVLEICLLVSGLRFLIVVGLRWGCLCCLVFCVLVGIVLLLVVGVVCF